MIAVGEHRNYWGRLCRRMLFWLSAELVLTVMGVDDLIDYIEYLRNRQQLIIMPQPVLSSLPALPKGPVDETYVVKQFDYLQL